MRVAATEDEKYITNTFIREGHQKLHEKTVETAHLSAEVNQMYELLATSMAETNQYKTDLHQRDKEIAVLKENHKEDLLSLGRKYRVVI